ncbi:MAG TPA: NADH-quinone oxidoreductase subunit L [Methylomirabilota bacterium]|nr:NADH-quinone oxidoreductase subunit L [Methylomirabilota bacterium]
MQTLVWLIPLAPLVGSVVNMVFGRFIRDRAHWVALPAVGLSFLFASLVFSRVWHGEVLHAALSAWIVAGSFKTAVTAHVDQLSALMLLIVTGVGFLIHCYSVGYMHGDSGYARYFTYLNLFVFSMVMLVLAGDFLLLYVFWEAVGLCSYLLIGFWYQRKSAADAGKKAFIVNRVGDFGFGLGVMLLWTTLGTLDYQEVFAKAGTLSPGTATAIALLLFMGACGKSAQLPLHTWLPDAMEGPTPVSALIHAATMVTAGVYMVARAHVIFERSGFALDVVLWVGALTAIFAATIGLTQTDIKRVLAYSTISQLGYMFVGLGVGAYAAGIYHLMTHAFFKALLFLGAGSVIHALQGEQDLRKMGGLAPRMFSTTMTFGIGALAISGFPLTSGFFSKDEILTAVYQSGHRGLWALLLVGAFLTVFYTFRLFFLTFAGVPRMSRDVAHHVHESPRSMTLPLWALAVLALAAGFVGFPLGKGTAISHFLAPVFPLHAEGGHSGALFALSAVIAVGGILLAWGLYGTRRIRAEAIGQPKTFVHRLLLNKYYVDELYDLLVVRPIYALSQFAARRFDLGVIDGIVNGIGRLVVNIAGRLRRIQTGYAMNYALGMLLGAVALIGLFLFR